MLLHIRSELCRDVVNDIIINSEHIVSIFIAKIEVEKKEAWGIKIDTVDNAAKEIYPTEKKARARLHEILRMIENNTQMPIDKIVKDYVINDQIDAHIPGCTHH